MRHGGRDEENPAMSPATVGPANDPRRRLFEEKPKASAKYSARPAPTLVGSDFDCQRRVRHLGPGLTREELSHPKLITAGIVDSVTA